MQQQGMRIQRAAAAGNQPEFDQRRHGDVPVFLVQSDRPICQTGNRRLSPQRRQTLGRRRTIEQTQQPQYRE